MAEGPPITDGKRIAASGALSTLAAWRGATGPGTRLLIQQNANQGSQPHLVKLFAGFAPGNSPGVHAPFSFFFQEMHEEREEHIYSFLICRLEGLEGED